MGRGDKSVWPEHAHTVHHAYVPIVDQDSRLHLPWPETSETEPASTFLGQAGPSTASSSMAPPRPQKRALR
eukprot:4456862-Alexandrium_andersonii.AAC.1